MISGIQHRRIRKTNFMTSKKHVSCVKRHKKGELVPNYIED